VIPGRILAIDLGEKRVGLAVSDPLGLTAQPLPTYLRRTLPEDLAHLKALVQAREVGTVVIGLPLKLDGSEGPAVERTRSFSKALAVALGEGVPIVELDERMTTARAARELRPLGRASDIRRRGELDRAAAQLLLGCYLGMRASSGGP
jgi:putative Holliday junction resolvase